MVQLEAWAQALPRPTANLVVSAHWQNAPLAIGATADAAPLTYDFYGFPQRYYQARYPARGAPALASRVRALLAGREAVADVPDRGLDHGAYVPLTVTYPDADVPVLQISMPSLDPERLLSVGEALRALAGFRGAPAVRYAHPTTEHYAPLFVTLGAAKTPAPVTTITG